MRLNRPEVRNAIDDTMRSELIETFDVAKEDETLRVVLLTGVGKAFSSGGDIKRMRHESPGEVTKKLSKSHELLRKMVSLGKPILAAVNGVAAGMGCNLVLASDLIIASEEASFSQAFIRVGLVPDFGGMFFLPRLIGLAKSKELVFFGDPINAYEAARIGLINYVVPHEQLEEEAQKWAQRLAIAPTRAIGMAKSILIRSLNLDFETALQEEVRAQVECTQTMNHKEGVRAFKEKRRPKFVGN